MYIPAFITTCVQHLAILSNICLSPQYSSFTRHKALNHNSWESATGIFHSVKARRKACYVWLVRFFSDHSERHSLDAYKNLWRSSSSSYCCKTLQNCMFWSSCVLCTWLQTARGATKPQSQIPPERKIRLWSTIQLPLIDKTCFCCIAWVKYSGVTIAAK